MKKISLFSVIALLLTCAQSLSAQVSVASSNSTGSAPTRQAGKKLFMDVHNLEPGKVTFADVMAAHKKDLATEGKYGVSFIKFWVDEKQGKVFCLSEAPDSTAIINTHKEAHGLLPAYILKVQEGQ